ncbi:unnamed protein product [Adineta steineri]|uniref:SAM domain-containing protein n=1 Tax=Adineta steineri TaxID=433720 RepID=A0A818PII5_9BILA|nr:unnamed protein product [Adineta steineri]
MDSVVVSTKSHVLQWDADAVVAWLHESNFGAFEKVFRDNDIDGPTLLKLSESMVVRLFPTIKLEVQFLDLLQALKQRNISDNNSKKTLASSSNITNGHNGNRHSAAHQIAAHVIASTSFDNGIDHSSNSNSPIPSATNGHHHPRVSYSERSQIPQRLTPKGGPPLKTLKREPKYFPNASLNASQNGDTNENDSKHTFPHVYKLPQFPDTLRLALASQDASAFKLRTYYRNLLISSIYDDLTRSYNLWYPNARQYKTVASALVKSYPFLESSTDGGEGAWIDGIKGKFKRGRRTATSHFDASQSMTGENGYDRMSGDDELGEEKLAQTSNGQKRSRHEFEVDSDDGQYESGEMPTNGKDNDQTSDNNDEMDEEETHRLRSCITAMQETLAATDDPDISLISDYFKETFEIRRNFVKTHNTTEILTEYPALQLHSCLLADFHMQTNIPIQTVLIHKLRSISKPIIRLAKETGCAPEILLSYHTILSQRPQLEQILADTFAILIVACYFGEYQFLLVAPEKDTQSPWPIIRGEHPATIFYDGKSSSVAYNIELDYVQLFHRPLNDFLTAICTLFATYTVFEITYGKLEMTLSFIDCLLRDNVHSSTRSPQVLELINELNSMKNM